MEQFFVDSHQTLTFMLDLVSQHISILQGPSRPVNLSLFYLVKLPYQSSSKLTAHEMKTCSRLFYTVLFLLCPNSGFFLNKKGYSGADITSFCRDAALMSMRKVIKDKSPSQIKMLSKIDLEAPVTLEDFTAALERTCRTVKSEDAKKHEEWIKQHGSY